MTLNTPGKSDGTLVEYIDDHKVLDLSNQKWREGNQVAIDFIKMDTFFGGSTTDWAPSKDQYVYFDNFIVTTSNPIKNSGK